jgi:hypothetical protein
MAIPPEQKYPADRRQHRPTPPPAEAWVELQERIQSKHKEHQSEKDSGDYCYDLMGPIAPFNGGAPPTTRTVAVPIGGADELSSNTPVADDSTLQRLALPLRRGSAQLGSISRMPDEWLIVSPLR